MAYSKSKKNIDADTQAANAATAVKNYGDFTVSAGLNDLNTTATNAYNSLNDRGSFTTANWSDDLKGASQSKKDAEAAVANRGSFTHGLQSTYDDILNQSLNRGDFTYDLNGDALYQQYKDQYMAQGKMAMMDTMGQSAAMTGGYGNSWAQTAGQQAYQGYLQQLNDRIPELYQLALDKYNSDGQNLYNKLSMLNADRATKYGEWSDETDRLYKNLDYASGDFYNLYGLESDAWTNENDRLANVANLGFDQYNTGWNQEYNAWESGLNMRIDQRDYLTNIANTIYDQEYGAYRDGIEDEQFNKNYEASTGYTVDGQKSAVFGNDEDFQRYTFAGTDADGNSRFYRDGKEYTFENGTNPYTGTTNPDTKNGTFGNGYQPDNVNGKKLSKTGITDVVNGVTQNVWKDTSGQKWIWDGTKNAYLKYED